MVPSVCARRHVNKSNGLALLALHSKTFREVADRDLRRGEDDTTPPFVSSTVRLSEGIVTSSGGSLRYPVRQRAKALIAVPVIALHGHYIVYGKHAVIVIGKSLLQSRVGCVP